MNLRIGDICVLLILCTVALAQEPTQCTLPDCEQAKAFFQKFQQAVDSDRRQDVAAMVRYPLKTYRNGKSKAFQNKSQLIAGYDSIFDSQTRCAIKESKADDVWGNWRGFTVALGVIWWDRIIPKSASTQTADLSKGSFGVFSVNHGGPMPQGCENSSPH